jgi:KAP-like P-loop domain-containing protein
MTKPRAWWDDDPIEIDATDDLQRHDFALQVANIVTEIGGGVSTSSTVIGLTGPWGSGKTSTLQTAVAVLDTTSTWCVEWLNPWALSGPEAVTRELIASIAAALPPGRRFDKLKKSIVTYGRYATPLMNLLPIAGQASSSIADAYLAGRDTVDHLAKGLGKRLREMDQRILIVVDDIDRLQPDELLAVFRSVRALGRLPNVHYLLAYDPETLVDVLTHTSIAPDRPDRALAYLEKVVTIRLDQPPTTPVQTDRLLKDGLAAALAQTGTLTTDQAARLDLERLNLLVPLLREPRRVRRFLSQVRCYLPLVGPEEVDPVDFAVLCLLRLTQPDLYEALYDDRLLLSGAAYDATERLGSWRDGAKVTGLVTDARLHGPLSDALVRIFPLAALGAQTTVVDVGARRRSLRVSDPDYVERYFALNKATEPFPDLMLTAALTEWAAPDSLGTDGTTVLETLTGQTDEPERVAQILRRLTARAEDVPPHDAAHVLTTLLGNVRLTNGDGVWRGELGQLVAALLVRIPDEDDANIAALASIRQVIGGVIDPAESERRLAYTALVSGIRYTDFARHRNAAPQAFLSKLARQLDDTSWDVLVRDLNSGISAHEEGSDFALAWLESSIGSDELDRRLLAILNGGVPVEVLAAHFVEIGRDISTGRATLIGFDAAAFAARFEGRSRVESAMTRLTSYDTPEVLDEDDTTWPNRVAIASRALIKWHRTGKPNRPILAIESAPVNLIPLRDALMPTGGDNLPDLQVGTAFALGGRIGAETLRTSATAEEQESLLRFHAHHSALSNWLTGATASWHLTQIADWETTDGRAHAWSDAQTRGLIQDPETTALHKRIEIQMRLNLGIDPQEQTPALQVSCVASIWMDELDERREPAQRKYRQAPLPASLSPKEMLDLLLAALATKEVAFDLWNAIMDDPPPPRLHTQLALRASGGIGSVIDLRNAQAGRVGNAIQSFHETTYDFTRERIDARMQSQGPPDNEVAVAVLAAWTEEAGYRGLGEDLQALINQP